MIAAAEIHWCSCCDVSRRPTVLSPRFSPVHEMIAQRSGLMKYIPVFHSFGVALRSKSVPDGFVTMYLAKERNNRVYFRLSKILCGFNDQVRVRPSGEKCGLGQHFQRYREHRITVHRSVVQAHPEICVVMQRTVVFDLVLHAGDKSNLLFRGPTLPVIQR